MANGSKSTLRLRSIEIVTLILEHDLIGKNYKTMGKAARDEELTVIAFRKLHCYMLSECRRTLPYIYRDIKHRTLDHSHKLALSMRRLLEMETSQHSIRRLGFIVLDETHFTYLIIEIPLREGFKEITPGVFEHAWLDYDYARDFCLNYIHILLIYLLLYISNAFSRTTRAL